MLRITLGQPAHLSSARSGLEPTVHSQWRLSARYISICSNNLHELGNTRTNTLNTHHLHHNHRALCLRGLLYENIYCPNPVLSALHHRKNYYLLKMYNLYNVENGSNRLAPNRSVKQEMKICFTDVFLPHCYKMTRVTKIQTGIYLLDFI